MKKFLKPLFHSALGRRLRDIAGYRPQLNYYNDFDRVTSSDLFYWTSEEDLRTVFKATDILGKYHDISSNLLLVINNRNGERLSVQRKKFDSENLTIFFDDSVVPSGQSGTFYALMVPDKLITTPVNVINRCYVGYGISEDYSMMHGNQVAIMCPLDNDEFTLDSSFPVLPALNPVKGRFEYFLQESLSNSARNTLLFTNPLARDITVKLMDAEFEIPSMGCEEVNVVVEQGMSRIRVVSDFLWPRPSIMIRRHGFIDVHHC